MLISLFAKEVTLKIQSITLPIKFIEIIKIYQTLKKKIRSNSKFVIVKFLSKAKNVKVL